MPSLTGNKEEHHTLAVQASVTLTSGQEREREREREATKDAATTTGYACRKIVWCGSERIITSSFWTRSLASGALTRMWRWDGLMKPSSTALSMNASSRL
jgi:hypothetical protein